MKSMDQICYVVHEADNAATAMADIEAGKVTLTGEYGSAGKEITALQPVPFGHKIALRDLEEKEPVIKYGACIGITTKKIRKGMHIHLHNMKSAYDFRSAELDPVTIHAKDIEYKVY